MFINILEVPNCSGKPSKLKLSIPPFRLNVSELNLAFNPLIPSLVNNCDGSNFWFPPDRANLVFHGMELLNISC